MSMLRFLGGGGKGKIHPPVRGSHSNATSTTSSGEVQMKLVVPNWGILYLPRPEAPRDDGLDIPRDDPMLNGELVLTLPANGGPKRCKSIRVALKTIITLDLGQGRRHEEDVLFERKVEIISSTSDGIWLSEGSQRFDFTIIIPANLASHDWHTNGVISHLLYAEMEGLPDPNEWSLPKTSSSTSLFGLRKTGGGKRDSRSGSRGGTPPSSPPLSPSMLGSTSRSSFALPSTSANPSTSVPPSPTIGNGGGAFNINTALANLGTGPATSSMLDQRRRSSAASNDGSPRSGSPVGSPMGSPLASPIPIPMGGGTRLNPAHLTAAQSLSITRQEAPMPPRAPSYDKSMAALEKNDTTTKSDWIIGTHTAKRNCMLVYNPHPTGGVNELNEQANGYIPGLGVWELQMVSDVWSIGALLSATFKLSNLSASTTVFSVKLILNQTHSIVSPRDPGGNAEHVSTRDFPILAEGKRPEKGYHFPDKRHPALWRGTEAGGNNDADTDGTIVVDRKCRMPNDIVARPSTLPGVITPITVSHTITLEAAFSVWGEDDLGRKMPTPSHGGLRLLKVSRPVLIPSCCLVPAVLDLPTYESHAKDRTPTEAMPTTGLPGWEWCSCGWQIAELESRMRQSIVSQQTAEANATAAANGSINSARSSEDTAKMINERGRQASR